MKIIKNKCCFIVSFLLIHLSFVAAAQNEGAGNSKPKLVVPYGHQLGIDKHFFSNNNKLMLTSDQEMTIVWDVRSGKPLHYLRGINPAISPDDSHIATTRGNRVLVWNTAGGKLLNELELDNTIQSTSFNAGRNLLLISYLTEDSKEDEEEGIPGFMEPKETDLTYDIAIWDYARQATLHTFRSGEKLPADCNDCSSGTRTISGGWFNATGDSVRIVYQTYLLTFSLADYRFRKTGFFDKLRQGPGYSLKSILNNHVLEILNDDAGTVTFLNEWGNIMAAWNIPEPEEGAAGLFTSSQEVISPDHRFYAAYENNSIILHDLVNQKELKVQLEGIKRLRFNKNSTHVLVEFLNEPPRVFETENFKEPASITERSVDGMPMYVFVTKTLGDSIVTANLAKSKEEVNVPDKKDNKKEDKAAADFMKKMLNGVVGKIMDNIQTQTKNAYTNSGEIVNLYNGRTISKIESLIKLSGDIKLSPDKKYLVVNNKQNMSVYSIEKARQVGTLNPSAAVNTVFTPNGKYLVQFLPLADTLCIYNLENGQAKKYRLKVDDFKDAGILSVNNKTIWIGNTKGALRVINVENGIALKTITGFWGFCRSENEDRYGYTSRVDGSVHVFRQKDSTEIFTVKLNDGKKEKVPAKPYVIEFGNMPNALAIWNSGKVVYYNDIKRPSDTLMLKTSGKISDDDDQREFISRVTISPNGLFLYIQVNSGVALVFNTVKKSFVFAIAEELSEKNPYDNLLKKGTGRSMRELESGNTESIDQVFTYKQIAAFSSTGDSLLVCYNDSVTIYKSADGVALKSFKVDGEIRYFSLPNNLVITYYYGQLKCYRLSESKEWFSIIPFSNNENVFLLPDGKYYGKNSVTRNLGYVYGDKSLSYKQFDFSNNRPDIVLRTLGNTDPEYLALYDTIISMHRVRERLTNKDLSGTGNPPEISITNDKSIPGEVKEKEISLKLSMRSNSRYLSKLSVFINGNPAFGNRGIHLTGNSNKVDTTIKLILSEGQNIIEVSVFDNADVESYRQPVYLQYIPDKPVTKNIYLVGVGAARYSTQGKDLKYPKNDIMAIYDTLKRWYPNRVHVDTLFNNNVTVENLMKFKSALKQSKPDDIVIVYYSGHGEIDTRKAEAFFGTYDIDFKDPSVKGISINNFNDLMDDIPARNRALFLDACHSGELYKMNWVPDRSAKNIVKTKKLTPAMSDDALDKLAIKGDIIDIAKPGKTDPFDLVLEIFSDLYQGSGTNIIVAARGLEVAKECDEIGHGVFTFSVLKGMSRLAADYDKNAALTIGELRNYVIDKVNIVSTICDSQVVQRAASRKENEYNDWALLDNSSLLVKKKSQVSVAVTESEARSTSAEEPANKSPDTKKENVKENVKEKDEPEEEPAKEIKDLINGAIKKIPFKLPKKKKGG